MSPLPRDDGPVHPVCLHDRAEIAALLRADPALHVYELGDLDDFFWPHTTWYADPRRRAVALLYTGAELPTLLAITPPAGTPALRALLGGLPPVLPRRFYAHLTDGVDDVLAADYTATPHGEHLKLALTDAGRLAAVDTAAVRPLTTADQEDILGLYAASYPGNWFDPRMLETGQYVGLRRAGQLVAVAGVHVYSRVQRVAAVGNIATHPDHRGQGLATAVSAALCRRLLDSVSTIGLNVKADNAAALACYRRLGFTPVATYTEATFTAQ